MIHDTIVEHSAATGFGDERPQEGVTAECMMPNADSNGASMTSDVDEQRVVSDGDGRLHLPGPTQGMPSYAAFQLGELTAEVTMASINSAYERCVHFLPNAFSVPNGNAGRRFISELASYYAYFGDGGAYDRDAFLIAAVYQMLMLQRPVSDSPKFANILLQRLDLWSRGDLNELLREAETIQASKRRHIEKQKHTPTDPARNFANNVTAGKLPTALHELMSDQRGGVHSLDDDVDGKTVREILREKHPHSEPMKEDAVIEGEPPDPPHPVYFSSLGRQRIKKAALDTQGAAGPSGVDAEGWRHMCSGFSDASDRLCDALASCARRLATEYVCPDSLKAFTACRLIALNNALG